MPKDAFAIKKITDIADELKQKDMQRALLAHVEGTRTQFFGAYQDRRNTFLEINALYKNKSYLDKNRTEWQTKSFIPLIFNAVERKTSIVHQALWGNRIYSPYTAFGKTNEDDMFAKAVEGLLNNTMDSAGFYTTSEEGIRSSCKYGLGAYRYGWLRRTEKFLARETMMDEKGKIVRDENGRAKYRFFKKPIYISRPFIRSVDVVDSLGWDVTAKSWDKWSCDYMFELREETPEHIFDAEQGGSYDEGSFEKLKLKNPHQLSVLNAIDAKTPQMRRDEGLQDSGLAPIKPRYEIVDWFGWFDIDGDGKREFVRVQICDKKLILSAEEYLLNEYPFVDIPYSRSLHSMTPMGVVDSVIPLQYEINELHNQRGDSIKFKINPQFVINVDKILEDHAYISYPGAMHPISAGDEDVANSMKPLEFQVIEGISANEESTLVQFFDRVVGVSDYNSVLSSSNKDTPATTVASILNEQQSTNAMIINGILERHGELGQRIFQLIQLFGDEEFTYRTLGRKGVEMKQEQLENILGRFDIKVTTSGFFGNKQIELQQLIQLKQVWINSPDINQQELDRSILEIILPKKVESILNIPPDPLEFKDERLLFIFGQDESVTINPNEPLIEVQAKVRDYMKWMATGDYHKLSGYTKEKVQDYFLKLQDHLQQLQTQQQLIQAQAAKAAGADQGQPQPGGQPGVPGSPAGQDLAQQFRPRTNNF